MAKRLVTTLCIVHSHSRVLLGLKKKGFGLERWNGFGGKVEEGETVEEAARRELFEECGITAQEMKPAGTLVFDFKDKGQESIEMHVFSVSTFEGDLKETDEMRPRWFHVDKVPFGEMWPDDKLWMPLLLEGRKFFGKFLFEDFSRISEYKLDVEKPLV